MNAKLPLSRQFALQNDGVTSLEIGADALLINTDSETLKILISDIAQVDLSIATPFTSVKISTTSCGIIPLVGAERQAAIAFANAFDWHRDRYLIVRNSDYVIEQSRSLARLLKRSDLSLDESEEWATARKNENNIWQIAADRGTALIFTTFANIADFVRNTVELWHLRIALATLEQCRIAIVECNTYLNELENAPHYLRIRHIALFRSNIKVAESVWDLVCEHPVTRCTLIDCRLHATHELIALHEEVAAKMGNLSTWRRNRNEAFVSAEVRCHKAFFEKVVSKVTDEQCTAAVIDDNAERILAGAGTGKTSTLQCKAAYLSTFQDIPQDQILAITYSTKSKRAMKARFSTNAATKDVKISTIHALGLQIIGLSNGRKPTVAPWAKDDEAFNIRANDYIAEIFRDPSFTEHIAHFSLLDERRTVPGYQFDDIAQYQDYLLRVEAVTLKREKLKSVQEVLIANFLFINNIEYIYEAPYKIDTASSAYAQYHPDFYLPDADIYIEHYGINRHGNTAPGIDPNEYAQGMAWKRALHASNGTICLETFSYQAQEGSLLEDLARALDIAAVPRTVIQGELLLAQLQEKQLQQVRLTLKSFVTQWKERANAHDSLSSIYAHDKYLLKHAVPTLSRFIELYEHDLKSNRFIDYSDMVLDARKEIENHGYICPYRVVLLDEAQDLSHARARLVRAFVRSAEDIRFTAVGDDWQSIYRFAGAHLESFVDFDQHFGPNTVSASLSQTHRFDRSIEAPSSSFISKNPRQTQRSLISRDAQEPALHFLSFGLEHDEQTRYAMEQLANRYDLRDRSITIVYRTNFHKPHDLSSLKRSFPLLRAIATTTAHSAKGLEDDFVVVLEANASWFGFPSVRPVDPVIEPLLPSRDSFQDAEERRLFYVAMTRARIAVMICFRKDLPAPFIHEIFRSTDMATMTDVPLRVADGVSADDQVRILCRSCEIGEYKNITVSGRTFTGCSLYPACRETAAPCPKCGGIITTDDNGHYLCSMCSLIAGAPCPKCKRGWLLLIIGHFGEFTRCSRWRKNRMGCDYKRS